MTVREASSGVIGAGLTCLVVFGWATGDWSGLIQGLAALCLGRALAAWQNEREGKRP